MKLTHTLAAKLTSPLKGGGGGAPPPPPVAAVIQQSLKLLDSNVTASSFTKTNAFPSMPTPGNSLVLILSVFNVDPASVQTVTIGGYAATLAHTNTRGNIRSQVWYVPSVGGSPNRNVTIAYSGAADYKYQSYSVLECTPLAASPVDLAQSLLWYDYLGTPVGWPLTLTAAAPTAQANELLIGQVVSGSGMADCLINSPAAGSTSAWYEVNADSYQGGEASYRILTSVETPTMAWSKRAGTTADHWDTILVSLKFA